jgi:hypothetical protein
MYGFRRILDRHVSEGLHEAQDHKPMLNYTNHPDFSGWPGFVRKSGTIDGRALNIRNLPLDSTAGIDGYLAGAVANLDADPDLDVWTIDHHGKVSHVSDDCAAPSP